MEGLSLGNPLFLLDSVDSTNNFLKAKAVEGEESGAVALADTQSAGRGRAGNSWLSGRGKGVYMSVLLRPVIDAADSVVSSMAVAVAVVEALRGVGLEDAGIKPPNDVLVKNRKIAGILVEPRIGGRKIEFIVAGIGVNVLYDENGLAGVWNGKATSCAVEGVRLSCDDVFIAAMKALDKWLKILDKRQFNDIFACWNIFQC